MFEFTVDGNNIALAMFTRSDVPEAIASEVLGLMHVINGVEQFSYGYTPVWDVRVERDRLEVHAQVNRIDVDFTRRW